MQKDCAVHASFPVSLWGVCFGYVTWCLPFKKRQVEAVRTFDCLKKRPVRVDFSICRGRGLPRCEDLVKPGELLEPSWGQPLLLFGSKGEPKKKDLSILEVPNRYTLPGISSKRRSRCFWSSSGSLGTTSALRRARRTRRASRAGLGFPHG